MSPEVLQECLDAKPFAPITVEITDHSSYEIESPDEARLTDDGSALRITKPGVRILVSLNHIVSVSFASPSERPFGFGRRPKDNQ